VANLPHVEVEFTQANPSAVPPQSTVAAGSVGGTASPMETRLEKQLGGHAEFDRFSTELTDLAEGAMKRVYAVHNLAQKFSPEDEAQLSSHDLDLLHDLSRKHTAELAEKIAGMEKILIPTLTSLGGAAAGAHPASHAKWQPATEDVFSSANRVDKLISQMLGMTPGNALPSDLMSALRELRANVEDCQKALK
jgi:hypothetical protein